ncbi:MAG: hypothetical protein ACD_79C00242G0001, partial [uncultured bacterium]
MKTKINEISGFLIICLNWFTRTRNCSTIIKKTIKCHFEHTREILNPCKSRIQDSSHSFRMTYYTTKTKLTSRVMTKFSNYSCILIFYFCFSVFAEQTEKLEYKTLTAKKDNLLHYYYTTGTLIAPQVTHLGPQVNGEMKEVYADTGDIVKKDQTLALIDPLLFELDVKSASSQMDISKIEFEDANLNFARMDRLFNKDNVMESAISKKNHEDALIRLNIAKANNEKSVIQLKRAQERLKQTKIIAPYDCVILRKLVDPGEPVTSAPITYIMDIAKIDSRYLEFSVPQEALAYINDSKDNGTEVVYTIKNICPETKAYISKVFPEINIETRTIKCRVVIPNADYKLKPGLLAEVKVIDRKREQVISIPKNCLIPENGNFSVQVLKDKRVIQKIVKLGMETEDNVEIIEGLTEGEFI